MRRFVAAVVAVACTCGLVVMSSGGAATAARAQVSSKTVPLIIAKDRRGSTAAIAKVYIHGHPYPFLIDTGATTTVVNFNLARKLGLKRVGKLTKVTGVGCTSSAQGVRISHWRIGTQPLPPINAVSVKIPMTGGKAISLLGSDLLSRFGAIRLDYQRAALTLG
ncbi:MAG: retropepsin-like aspartic protease [Solirubrobacteraceae bacterium]